MWFVSRRRHAAELAAVKAEADRLRGERDEALSGRDSSIAAAATAARLFAETDAANKRLAGRNRRLAELLAEQPRVPRTRLDRALTHPAVDAGVMWQSRRADKPKPAAKETTP
ncbi:hypothetical protein [Streptomyces sp. NPDC060001]|uniref:hypothetical protein n=1 Tax=Streptomyces sp. NPDC060001 TaxID=3347032 RepID=UPI003674EF8A